MIRVSAEFKRFESDPDFDIKLDKWKSRVLGRIGAYTASVLRNSIKRDRKTIIPGRPPRQHVKGRGGLKFVLFDVHRNLESVLVGVARSPKSGVRVYRDRIVKVTSVKSPPQLLNESGKATYFTQYIASGSVTMEDVVYRTFPISTHKPTGVKVRDKFQEFVTKTRF